MVMNCWFLKLTAKFSMAKVLSADLGPMEFVVAYHVWDARIETAQQRSRIHYMWCIIKPKGHEARKRATRVLS
jgi:hypothetical protein